MINIKCPNCNVKYSVERINSKKIRCQDCGTEYHQGFCSANMPKWVGNMAYNIRHYGK